MARILTTVVGSYPLPDWLARAPSEQALVDATRVVIATQERAGIDLVCDGELYRFDVNHPETNGMIEYFVRPMAGVRSDIGFSEWLDYSKGAAMLGHCARDRASGQGSGRRTRAVRPSRLWLLDAAEERRRRKDPRANG